MPTPAEYKRLTEKFNQKWSGDEGQRRATHPYTTGGEPARTARDEAAGLRGGPGKEPKWVKDLID